MAEATDYEIKPDHIIIWLDENMAPEGVNEPSKDIIRNDANLNDAPSSQAPSEIDNLICSIGSELNTQEVNDLIKSPLHMSINEGAMGSKLIPKIHKTLSGYIYVFCGQRHLHEVWTKDYEKDIEIYDDERGVFAKVLSDIAIYYLQKCEDYTPDPNAGQYLQWSQRLFKSAARLDNNNRDDFLKIINTKLNEISESSLNRNNGNDQIGRHAREWQRPS